MHKLLFSITVVENINKHLQFLYLKNFLFIHYSSTHVHTFVAITHWKTPAQHMYTIVAIKH